MRWIKVAAVVGGVLIVFFVLDSLVHLFLGLLTTLVFVALVAGGIAVAVKIASSRRKKQVSSHRDEYEVREEPRSRIVAVPPTPSPTARSTANVDDELARLKREMGG